MPCGKQPGMQALYNMFDYDWLCLTGIYLLWVNLAVQSGKQYRNHCSDRDKYNVSTVY